jgi:FixJ family two-component response regulator
LPASPAFAPVVAIIDDDASLRTALVVLLRSFGYAAAEYSSADLFLANVAGSDVSCIVTDIHMPGISGIDLKNELTKLGIATPVIMITARTDVGLDERARASGAICVLRKPFAADALVKCIQSAIDV